jgi:hypothetical protein
MEQEIINKIIRCPRLGDEMTFSYCLQESGEFPCARIVRCWSSYFDVESFLKQTMAPEKWDRYANSRHPDKVTSLIEMIAAAKAKK